MLALPTAFVAAAGGLRGIADLLLRGKGAADDYAALAEHAAAGTAPRSMAPVPARLTQGVTLRGGAFADPGTERAGLADVDLDRSSPSAAGVGSPPPPA